MQNRNNEAPPPGRDQLPARDGREQPEGTSGGAQSRAVPPTAARGPSPNPDATSGAAGAPRSASESGGDHPYQPEAFDTAARIDEARGPTASLRGPEMSLHTGPGGGPTSRRGSAPPLARGDYGGSMGGTGPHLGADQGYGAMTGAGQSGYGTAPGVGQSGYPGAEAQGQVGYGAASDGYDQATAPSGLHRSGYGGSMGGVDQGSGRRPSNPGEGAVRSTTTAGLRGGGAEGGFGAGAHPPISQRGRGPKGYSRPDSRVCEEVCDRLTEHHEIDASDVSVEVSKGVVRLTGTVDARRVKHLIEDVVEGVTGVVEIDNQIRVARRREGEGVV